MQVGKLVFQLDMQVGVAANIASAARACTDIVERFFHRADDFVVLAHAQVIVRAPHGDRLRPVMPVEAARVGVRALVAHDVDENAVASFLVKTVDRLVEDLVVIHVVALLVAL